jgi:hypothetical protein
MIYPHIRHTIRRGLHILKHEPEAKDAPDWRWYIKQLWNKRNNSTPLDKYWW